MVSNFEKDFASVTQIFPKLTFRKGKGHWIIDGEIDICDGIGDYWDTFEIEIYIPKSYPYCIPLLCEKSEKIRREADWHMDDKGFCCVDIPHKLFILERRGFKISDFIRDKVYPYFANQLYKMNQKQYAAGEYKHSFGGIIQFYEEELNLKNNDLIVELLQRIISNNIPTRNELCPCGKDRFKDCHLKSVDFLKSIPKDQLERDLKEFIEYKKASNP